MDKKINNSINSLIKEYSNLFNKYDFIISDKVPQDAFKAIEIGKDKYIVFTHKDIKETMNEKMKQFVQEQNEAFKEGKGWVDIENNEEYEE